MLLHRRGQIRSESNGKRPFIVDGSARSLTSIASTERLKQLGNDEWLNQQPSRRHESDPISTVLKREPTLRR